jgi:hypothetical protein
MKRWAGDAMQPHAAASIAHATRAARGESRWHTRGVLEGYSMRRPAARQGKSRWLAYSTASAAALSSNLFLSLSSLHTARTICAYQAEAVIHME